MQRMLKINLYFNSKTHGCEQDQKKQVQDLGID
jgi:hypothetical protein